MMSAVVPLYARLALAMKMVRGPQERIVRDEPGPEPGPPRDQVSNLSTRDYVVLPHWPCAREMERILLEGMPVT